MMELCWQLSQVPLYRISALCVPLSVNRPVLGERLRYQLPNLPSPHTHRSVSS